MNEQKVFDLLNLIETQKEYIKLLGEEINSMAGICFAHGMRSSDERIKRGEELRKKITKIEKELEI